MRACERLFTRFQQKIDALNDTVQENLIGIRVVKAFVRGDFERKKFKKSNDELRDAGLAAVMRVILISPVMMLSMYAAILGVMWFGGRLRRPRRAAARRALRLLLLHRAGAHERAHGRYVPAYADPRRAWRAPRLRAPGGRAQHFRLPRLRQP